MKHVMDKKFIGLLAAVMALSLAACGKEDAEEKSKDYVYKAEEVVLDEIENKETLGQIFFKGERMYLTGMEWSETGTEVSIISRDKDGSDSSTIKLHMESNQTLNYITADEQGNYYAVLNEYFEDSSDPENYIWENNFYLLKLDGQGNEIWKQPLVNDSKDAASEDYYGVSWMDILKDGRLIVLDTNGIIIYDTDGKLQKKVKPQGEIEISGAELFQLKDGSIVANTYKTELNKYVLNKLNIETGELSEDFIVPGGSGSHSYSYYEGIGYDLLLVDTAGVSGYNLGDTEVTKLMNFIDSDVNTSYIYNVVAISEQEFYAMMNDNLTGGHTLMRFTKVDPKDVVDKKILTLGCNGVNWDVRNQVVNFNKSSAEYRIQIRDYSEYNTEEDYQAGVTKLNTDIASGNVPDILILQNDLPVDSYLSKGLFEDLYPYIDKDEELNREDYFPNILKAYETDGKLYRVVPNFTINTVAGKTADVGTEEGWTLAELNELMAAKPEGTQIFAEMTRNNAMNLSMQMSGEQYINWKTGECKFNSEAFIMLLEFLKQFPEQIDDEYYDDSFWRSYDTMWREGRALLNMVYLDSFSSYNYMKKGIFGEDITLIGFPAENGKGASINANLDMVMSSKSKNKEGAWQFLRYFLTDEYQNKIEYGWPLSMKRLDYLEQKAKEKPTYEDENGNIVEYDQTYTVGDIEVVITPMVQEEIDEVLEYVTSIDQVYVYDQNLMKIIEEEAAPYFSGQKNAKEVAEIIQSRVQIYVNENR